MTRFVSDDAETGHFRGVPAVVLMAIIGSCGFAERSTLRNREYRRHWLPPAQYLLRIVRRTTA